MKTFVLRIVVYDNLGTLFMPNRCFKIFVRMFAWRSKTVTERKRNFEMFKNKERK